MIELLITYLQSRGYEVKYSPQDDLLPAAIYIRKQIADEMLGCIWTLANEDELKTLDNDALFALADEHTREFRYAENAHMREQQAWLGSSFEAHLPRIDWPPLSNDISSK